MLTSDALRARLQRRRLALECAGAWLVEAGAGAVTLGMEATAARRDDGGARECAHTASHMHNARTGKVDHACEDGVLVEGGEEARRVPDPVHDHGVDEADDQHDVEEVGD